MLTDIKPYLLRAYYEWIVDNQLTPYVLVNAATKGVSVPIHCVNEEQHIILNLSPTAVSQFNLNNTRITCHAKFSGVTHHLIIPIASVVAIYPFEDQEYGIQFDDERPSVDSEPQTKPDGQNTSSQSKRKVVLTVIK